MNAQKAGKRDADPDPEDFLMMDKEAVLDRPSLQKAFVYPDSARKAGLQGKVVVKVLIGKSGKAERYLVVESVHPLLDSAAARAVMSANFSPAGYAGENIKSWMEVPITFKMNAGRSQPVKIQGDIEGDGYQRSQFDTKVFYDALDKNLLQALKQPTINVSITVDAKGRCTAVQSPGVLPEAVLNNIRQALQQQQFVPALRDRVVAEDHLTLIIETQAR